MHIHKSTEYSIGHCLGKYHLNIPRLKYFKEFEMKHDAKNFEKIHQKAREIINEKENDLQRSSSKL